MDYKLVNEWLPNNNITKLQNKPLYFLNFYQMCDIHKVDIWLNITLSKIYKVIIHPFEDIILDGNVIYSSETLILLNQRMKLCRREPQDFFGKIYTNYYKHFGYHERVKSILCTKNQILPLICSDKFFTDSNIYVDPYEYRHKLFQFLKNHPNNFITEWN